MSGYPVDEPTDLNQRMKLHKMGQLTWPEPKLKKGCASCRHFTTNADDTHLVSLKDGHGVCALVYAHHKSKSMAKQFRADAVACPKFESFK